MSRLVLDASVACASLLKDDLSTPSDVWLDRDIEWLVPDIFVAECCHALIKRHRRELLDEDELAAGLSILTTLELEIVETAESASAATQLAAIIGVTAYDAFYLVVAIARDATLVTCDRLLHDRAVATGLGDHVIWIEDAG